MNHLSYLNNAHTSYIESLYESYKADPQSVDFEWQKFFEGFELARSSSSSSVTTETPDHFLKELQVLEMIEGYRDRGHLFTKTNPVRERRKYYPGKELSTFGLSESDLDTVFQAGNKIGLGPAKLRDIVDFVEQTYCQSIGAEFKYIRHPDKIKWLQDRIEANRNTPNFSTEERKQILYKLNQAVVFENFLGTKFLGQKRFSLEGAESLIPALDAVIEKGSELGINEFAIGMAHRGRLNVLANIMNKSYKDIFAEFEGNYEEDDNASGDVKYHLGYSTDINTKNGKSVHLSLAFNPSHLEAVDPVVEGVVRAKMDLKYGNDHTKIAPILIHGDASVAGQGIVYEVIQMSKLDGYKTGGTIHLVINNQVGFTTNFKDARSSTYCTDIAKVTLSPVFHVNGDDVEAVVHAIRLAMEYRQQFHTDVFIDLLCYRRYGHNESDEPRFTQPLLYKIIEKHPNPKTIYSQKLTQNGTIDEAYAKNLETEFKGKLQGILDQVKSEKSKAGEAEAFGGSWKDYRFAREEDFVSSPDTSISEKTFKEIGKKITEIPADKKVFRKIANLFKDRAAMIESGQNLDWAMGELMAYGTLLNEGHSVRLSGQDVERGTFSHRHAVLTLEDSEGEYVPLQQVTNNSQFNIYNSHLSEFGVLGFEYGYAITTPNHLTIWEAQFGDFFNGAQTIIDQFISSAETKWRRSCGLVMLLPHGFEGQGPEHSSGRIERFLELCANNNMQIVNCTSPANQFHALRRQLKRDFRKPLVCFTPKSLLRHPACTSNIEAFTKGKFQEVIDDTSANPKKIKRIAFCSGKIYYDLIEEKQKQKNESVAIVRLEQLYPLPTQQLEAIIEKYKGAEVVWVQEEPRNMGAWPFILRKFRQFNPTPITRKESSSPATGYLKQHLSQQEYIIKKTFEIA
jgi:2-oxoglutarate dehydrogenase E1 component